MWRIDESRIGSYTGRMAPPGRPNMTSTPCISRLLMRAWAPVSSISAPCRVGGVRGWGSGFASGPLLSGPGHENDLPSGGRGAHRCGDECALGDEYQDGRADEVARGHNPNSLARHGTA